MAKLQLIILNNHAWLYQHISKHKIQQRNFGAESPFIFGKKIYRYFLYIFLRNIFEHCELRQSLEIFLNLAAFLFLLK